MLVGAAEEPDLAAPELGAAPELVAAAEPLGEEAGEAVLEGVKEPVGEEEDESAEGQHSFSRCHIY